MLSIVSCVSSPVYIERELIFPPMPEPMRLTENVYTNEYLGMVKDIEWYKWGLFAKLEAGIIDQEKYDSKIHEANETLQKFDDAFNEYKKSLLE